MLVVSLPPSCKNLKEILLCSNNDTLYFEDVKANLLSTENFDLEVRGENFEGLFVRGKSYGNGTTAKSQVGRPGSNKFFHYCRKTRHVVSECFKLKNQREKEESNTPSHSNEAATATFVESDSDGDVLFATSTKKGGILIGF